MRIYLVQNDIYFRGNSQNDEHKGAKITATAVGATGATVASKNPFPQISRLTRVNKQVNVAARDIKTASEIAGKAKETTGIFAKFGANCSKFKQSIIAFGQKFANSKLIKPIVESKLYKGAASVGGGLVAGCVALAGIGDITNTVTRKVDQITH